MYSEAAGIAEAKMCHWFYNFIIGYENDYVSTLGGDVHFPNTFRIVSEQSPYVFLT